MKVVSTTHPNPDVLRAFGLGKLNDASSEVVSRHLEDCPDCKRQVAQLPDDSLLEHLRKANGPVATPPPAKSLAALSEALGRATATPGASADTGGAPPLPASLPPALRDNDEYEIVRQLGAGGMGVVYLARHKLTQRLEVLKVIGAAMIDKPSALERFLREIQAAATLHHDNVVGAYTARKFGDLLVFSMEYVDGEDLSQLVKSQGPLPVANACHYVRQAALGLQHAHEKKMVHRDIKPVNLMLARDGKKHTVKILDFGLAKATSEKGVASELTSEGAMLGTPAYMAPEQILDAASADIRADIYSLGCTLYYLLTGAPPFRADSLFALLQAHQSTIATAIDSIRPDVPAELAAIVAKMMAKEPDKRYQKPLEVAQTLAKFVTKTATKEAPAKQLAGGPARETLKADGPRTQVPVKPAAAPLVAMPIKQETPIADLFSFEAEPAVKKPAAKSAKGGAPKRRMPWLWAGAAAGVVLLGVILLGASGVFSFKTKDGVIVVQVSEPNAEILVDGEKAIVTWGADRKKAEISVNPGTRKVRVTVEKEGFSTYGEEVVLEAGGRPIVTARLEKATPTVTAIAQPTPTPGIDSSKGLQVAEMRFAMPVDVEQPLHGTWEIKNNELVQRQWVWGGRVLFGDKQWTDVDFSVEGQMIDGNCGFGLLVRDGGVFLQRYPQDGTNRHKDHLIFLVGGFGNTHHYLERVLDGKGQLLADAALSPADRLKKGEWYAARVSVRGNRVQCFLNAKKLFDVATNAPTAGVVGLMTWDAPIRFRNIKVVDPSGKVLLEGLPDFTGKAQLGGFVPLFNGKDIQGWRPSEATRATWRVDEGTLIGSGDFGYLITDRNDFENFRLRIEAKLDAGGDSGLCFRVQDRRTAFAYEAQIGAGGPGMANTGSFVVFDKSGGPIMAHAPQAVPPGKWFSMEVLAEGNRFTIWVDGKQTVQYEDKEKRYARGAIALQQIGPKTEVSFRKVEIKELPAATTAAAPVGEPNKETEIAQLKQVLLSNTWHYHDSLFPPGDNFRFNADGTWHKWKWNYWVVGPQSIRVHYDRNNRNQDTGVLFTFNADLTRFTGEFSEGNKRHKIIGTRK